MIIPDVAERLRFLKLMRVVQPLVANIFGPKIHTFGESRYPNKCRNDRYFRESLFRVLSLFLVTEKVPGKKLLLCSIVQSTNL